MPAESSTMPPRRGQKRAARDAADHTVDGTRRAPPLAPPDRHSWPGWVEMESEPAFFNVMLREMGVRGVQVQDVLDLHMLPAMPQPVHALIFLFRYKPQDEADSCSGSEQAHIWFANQVPSFACATVALLNIVNNISGLTMGPELRRFKRLTQDLDPLARGDAVDAFDFVRRIHNSFARESDLLDADLRLKNKVDQYRKREAAAKGRATKAAKKAAQEGGLAATSPNTTSLPPARSSGRAKKPTAKVLHPPWSEASAPQPGPVDSASSSPEPDGGDDSFEPRARKRAKSTADGECAEPAAPRRSARTPKPRDAHAYQPEAGEADEGFHFVAYMPIGDHVWKLDGLDYHPHDVGGFGGGGHGADGGTGDWLHVVAPAIEKRMAQYAGADIEFNIMAVVHDPAANAGTELLANIKTLQTIDKKLDLVFADWRALDGGETKNETITGASAEFEITQRDVDGVELASEGERSIAGQDGLVELMRMRQSVMAQQTELRGALRAWQATGDDDEEKARHRRHDYGRFVKRWLGALAEQQVLEDLVGG